MREKITAFRELTANCGGHCGGRQSPNRAVRGGTGESLGHCGRKHKRESAQPGGSRLPGRGNLVLHPHTWFLTCP